MVGDHVRGVDTKSRTSRARATAGARCRKRAWLLEGLEDRLLLSGSPTIYTVNSTDGGVSGSGDSGTLPYVIGLANADSNTAGSEIQFDPTVFASPQTITLSSTLELSETAGPEVIDGPGANLVTVSGNGTIQDFIVDSGVTATFSGLTISGGVADNGGAIGNSGTTTVTDSTIAGCQSYNTGGAISNGGTMTVTDSTIAGCVSGNTGGAIFNGGTMTVVTGSTIQGGFADGPGGAIENPGTMTVTGSTIDGNVSGFSDGGAIDNGGTLAIVNSTIADNTCESNDPSEPGNGGGINDSGTLTVTNSTVVYNSVLNNGFGAGLYISPGATATLNNSIFDLNTRAYDFPTPGGIGTEPDDIDGGAASSRAYNLIGVGASGGLVNGVNCNQVGVADPGLDPNGLQQNGGPTETIALVSGSPAIDAGSNALAVDPQGDPLTTDQRGPGFPRIGFGTVDIGASEQDTRLAVSARRRPAYRPGPASA